MATDYAVLHLDTVDSTQDEAFERFDDVPLLVTAQRQIRGRGRAGTEWVEPDRAVYASLALHPTGTPAEWGPLPLLAGVCAVEVLGTAGRGVRLKWPNDLLTAKGKVGGILVESRAGVVVAGWGCNLSWASPPPNAAAVFAVDPGPDETVGIAARWAACLLAAVARGFDHDARSRYLELCDTIGQAIEWDPDGSGTAEDVAADGGLIVRSRTGPITLRSATVRHVRPATMPPGDTEES